MAGRDAVKGRLTVSVRTAPGDGSYVLALAGELDHDSAEVLRTALAEGLASRPPRVVVDFAELGFCDSTGLNALLKARLDGGEAAVRLDLAALRPQVARMFDITGAGALFRRYASLDEALADRPQN
ncbi:STAS domain-containing protein [Streptomyces sp. NPDC051907]|uniref:STAS domain-containing protein n=1 Tax=Streptomyces sp. NPDC051907 TaxID=3155284 RepID=UPI00344891CD